MPTDSLLIKAGEYLKAGKKQEAGQILYQYLRAHPEDTIAWYGYSKCFTDLETRKQCLERAIELDPTFQKAKIELDEVKVHLNSTALMTQSTEKYSINFYQSEKPQPQQESNNPSIPQMLTTRKVANELGEEKHQLENAFWVLWMFVIFFGILALLNPQNSKLLLCIIGFTILVRIFSPIFFKKYSTTKKRQHRYEKGARGEETIVSLLSTLGPEYAVWHDVMTSKGNIDHIVLCKNGSLFMIETKAYSGSVDTANGRLLINGSYPKKDMIGQCLTNIYSLKESLESTFGQTLWINPILVFTNAFVKTGKPIKGVTVINKKYLLQTIQSVSGRITKNAWLWEKRQELNNIFSGMGMQS